MFAKKTPACFGKRSLVRTLQQGVSALEKDDLESMHDNNELENNAKEKAEQSKERMYAEEFMFKEKQRKEKEEHDFLERQKKYEEEKKKKQQEEEQKKVQPIPMDFTSVPDTHFLEKPVISGDEKKKPESVQLSTPLGEKKVYYTQILQKPQ